MSPETTFQKVRKAPAATSVHHIVPSCLIPSSSSLNYRQVSSMKFWIAFLLLNGTRLDLGVPANPHPAFGTPLPRAGEGMGVRARRTAFAMTKFLWVATHVEMGIALSVGRLGLGSTRQQLSSISIRTQASVSLFVYSSSGQCDLSANQCHDVNALHGHSTHQSRSSCC